MTPAERNAGMADCSLSGLMQAAMQDQEAAVAGARRAALEEAAQVVESHFYLLSIGTPEEGPFTRQDRVCLETREQAAAAIRALKEQEPTA